MQLREVIRKFARRTRLLGSRFTQEVGETGLDTGVII